MTIQELRRPKLEEVARQLQAHIKTGKCKSKSFDGAIAGACSCVPDRMFLYDLAHHAPTKAELEACKGGPIPEFLQTTTSTKGANHEQQ